MRQAVEVIPVTTRAEREAFIRLPDRLHRADPAWVPPLLVQRRAAVDPARNPYFAHAEVQLFLARRGGRVVGRASAQVDRMAVDLHGRTGHFGLLAAEDDQAVAALMEAAEAFLAWRGMRRARGPFNLSVNQECGLLVDGHRTPPSVMTPHDLPHLAPALEGLGYLKARDLLAYSVPVDAAPPPFVRRLLDGAGPGRLRLRRLDLGDYHAEIARALAIFNDAWSGNWGFVPFTEDEMFALGEEMRLVIDADLIWFAELDGRPVGMLVTLPDVNRAIRDLGGRLLPWGWLRALWRLKVGGVDAARVPLMGVRAAACGGLAAAVPFALVEAMRPHLRARGYRTVEMSWVLEDNLPMRRMAEALGGAVAKTWRIYERDLA